MDRKCTYCIFSKNAFFAVCFESIFHQKKDELLWCSVSQHSSGMKNWITSEVARVWKVSRIALQSFKLILAWFSIYLDLQLKVRQIRNDFFKPTFLPKKPTNKFDFTTSFCSFFGRNWRHQKGISKLTDF